tara:strand:+ start:241 stop:420 length:180 start_codon:yes stop_codon:yes gene_type:complete
LKLIPAPTVIERIAKNEAITLRNQAAEVPQCVRSTVAPTWVFIGKYAMPDSEHLIPFQV